MYYRKASEHAQSCVLTAVKYGKSLIAAWHLNEARRELERARSIDCHVHPMLHNIEITRDTFSKEELIVYTRKRIESQLLYIEVAEQDSKFAKILKKLGNKRVQTHSVLSAAAELADAQPRSVRAKLLYPHLVISLLSSGRLNDRGRGQSLSHALDVVKNLSISAPRSLVVSLVHLKLLVTLGFFEDSEKECARALQIEKPDDPWIHDIPLGSTSGDIYDDRIEIKRQQIACIIDSVVNMVKVEFSKLTEEQKSCSLYVRISDLLNQNEVDPEKISALMQAIERYKSSQSWVLWRCPDCAGFETADTSRLLRHVWCSHFYSYSDTDVEIDYNAVKGKLLPVKFVPFAGHHGDLHFARDSQGDEYVCIRSIDCLFNWARNRKMLPVLAGEEQKDAISPNDALEFFLHCLASVSEDGDVNDALETAWTQLLSSLAIDS